MMRRNIFSLGFYPIDPIYVGGSGEFSPEARGPATLGHSLTLPMPSTLFGSLLKVFYDNSIISTEGTLSDSYIKLCENVLKVTPGNLFIRGPYLKYRNIITTLIDKHIVRLYDIDREKIHDDFIKYVKHCIGRILGKVARKKGPFLSSVKTVESIGIGVRRPIKAVYPEGEGLIYDITRIDLASVSDYEHDTYIMIDVVCNEEFNIEIMRELLKNYKIVKLGGEGKIAELELSLECSLTEINLKIFERCHDSDVEYVIMLLLSPAILSTEPQKYVSVKDIRRYLLNGGLVDSSVLVGKYGKNPISLISLGYNTVHNVRRPLRLCVNPGSLLIVKKDEKLLNQLEKYIIEGIGNGYLDTNNTIQKVKASYIGYGSIMLLPVSVKLEEIYYDVKMLFRIVFDDF